MKETSTKTIVATGLGTALFTVLFLYVKVPSPIPNTNLQFAYGVSGFFAALFGPVCGFLIAFIGHALTDFISYGSPWWSWVLASGVSAFITGFAAKHVVFENGTVAKNSWIRFIVLSVIAHAIAWLLIAPGLDVLIYAEPANKVFAQGIFAVIADSIIQIGFGGLLLRLYAGRQTGKGTLSRE